MSRQQGVCQFTSQVGASHNFYLHYLSFRNLTPLKYPRRAILLCLLPVLCYVRIPSPWSSAMDGVGQTVTKVGGESAEK